MLFKRSLTVLIPLVASFFLVGCEPEERVTRVARPRLNDMYRLLAAIVLPDNDPDENKTWFFKLSGAESQIDPLVETFNQFLGSIRFADPGTPGWTLPPGWTEEKDDGKKLRYATIRAGAKDKAPELTVTALQGEKAASVPINVNRWRGLLGLKGLDAIDLEDFYRPLLVAGRAAIVVDMIGPANQAPMQPQEEPKPAELPFKFTTPPGWIKIPPANQFSVLSFKIVDKDQKAELSVSVAGGGLLDNVNRWRGQLKLAPSDEAQVKALPEVSIGAAKGRLVDITGPQAPPQKNRILGAILLRDRDSLFFKMTGPSDLVGRQKPALEAFLTSIRFHD